MGAIEKIYSSATSDHPRNRAPSNLDAERAPNAANTRSGSTGKFRVTNTKRFHTYSSNNGQPKQLAVNADPVAGAHAMSSAAKPKAAGGQPALHMKNGPEFDSRRSSNSQARKQGVNKRSTAITSTVYNGVKFQS